MTVPDPTERATTAAPAAAPARTGWWRPVLVTLLVLAAALLAPLAVVASWADDQVGDTDSYVATVEPLASDPAVQDAVVARITDEILERLDVSGVTREAVEALAERGLPPRAEDTLASLSVPLENQVRGFIEEQVGRLIRSDEFEQAWVNANREAHTQMVAVLTGKGSDLVDTQGGTVSVNLAAVIDVVKERLTDRGFDLASSIPEVNAQFTVFESADLDRAQTGFRMLAAVSTVLPWLAIALLAGAVMLARSRRRALIAGALAVAASMVLLGLTLNIVRLIYLDAVPPERLTPAAAASVFDALVYFIRLGLRAVLVLFLAIAVLAWVTGPAAQPTAVRRGLGRGVAAIRRGTDRAGLDTGAFGTTLHSLLAPIRIGILAVALLAYMMADHPTGAFTAVVIGVALLVLLVVEVLARPAVPAPTDQASPDQ